MFMLLQTQLIPVFLLVMTLINGKVYQCISSFGRWHGEGLGGDNSGQLGDGTTTSKLIPTTVPGLTNVKQLSTGSESPLR
ncbi:hypothetical protein [Paenibacillus sp. IITD108]|uniref:hypothetical protein n=1 Tax=Paenibacillus sp. IITD108 TaxID=3116649 RepID=UPI003FA69317